ncbi:MAG TPA: hypothetical protein VH352_25315 [Pseudonocardiaceae bacterium]|nr:hypothetical protein [Pseudonocardiaceae bacterium]
MTDSALATTRRFLHGTAELLLSGPQYRTSGRIELCVVAGGFATVAVPALRVDGGELVTETGRIGLHGRAYTEIAALAGVQAAEPSDVYAGGPGVRPDEVVTLDEDALAVCLRALALGESSLLAFAPDVERVLWPEHFDVAITVDRVNYGVSPGDGHIDEPYAYVGPHESRRGSFWNMTFGAARPLAELGDTEAVIRFFQAGRQLAH